MKRILLTLALTHLVAITFAQPDQLTCKKPWLIKDALAQMWSGGIAGRAGTNYSFTLETLPGLVPDTIWIKGTAFKVITQETQHQDGLSYNTTVAKTKTRWTYNVHIQLDRSNYGDSYRLEDPKKNEKKLI